MKKVLEYHLIEIDKYILTPYKIIIALLIVILTYAILKIIKKTLKANKKHIATMMSFYTLIKYILWVIAIIIILQTIGINITYLIASSAALLVGLGLGIQQIFNDIISGIFLLFEGNVKINDIVQINDIVATVKQINLRTSKVETRENVIMIIPNSKLISDNVINWSTIDENTRFSVKVGVSYGSDVEKVKEILLNIANKHDEISTKHKPFVRFTNFGNSSLDFELLFFTRNSFRVKNIKSELRFDIYKEFKINNITIPFPQQDIYIKEIPKNK